MREPLVRELNTIQILGFLKSFENFVSIRLAASKFDMVTVTERKRSYLCLSTAIPTLQYVHL